MIGLFDSGLGGLEVVRCVRERRPAADLLFFADQAHVPYGERTADDLHTLMRANIAWLDERGVEAIVMACNTSCAIADIFGWPPASAKILDLLDAAAQAVARSGARRIGVVATTATTRTGAYTRRIRSVTRDVHIVEVAAPALVPLVEAGEVNTADAHAAVRAVCSQLPPDLDALVYGCTHYPALDALFAAALAPTTKRIDPARMQVERLCTLLGPGANLGTGATHFVTNGALAAFRDNVIRITGEASPHVVAALPAPA